MRILLVNAPARELSDEPIIVPPLGLAYLAASARQAGHAVSILDAFAEGLTWTVFEERVRAAHTKLGLTVQAWFESPVQGGDGNHEFFIYSRK